MTTPAHPRGTVGVLVRTLVGDADAGSFDYVDTPRLDAIDQARGTADGGQTTTLRGTGLGDVVRVTFASAAATVVERTGTSVTVLTPRASSAGGSVDVRAATKFERSNGLTYTYEPTPVTIAEVTGNRGPIDASRDVTVTGANLNRVSSVLVGSNDVTLTNQSSTSLTFTVPPAFRLGAIPLVLLHDSGRLSLPDYVYTRPVITSSSPNRGKQAGGEEVVLSGTDLDDASAVTFGGAEATILRRSSTSVTVLTPAHAGGNVGVVLTGSMGTSESRTYRYGAASITSVSPGSSGVAGGREVTVTGIDLDTASSVTFDGTAGTIVRRSATSIVVRTPAHPAGRITMAVSTEYGVARTGFSYVVPSVTGISRAAGQVAGGQTLTITGTSLSSTYEISFGGVAADWYVVNDSTLSVSTPAHAAGDVDVVVKTLNGDPVPLRFSYGESTVTSLSRDRGLAAGGDRLILKGRGLGSTTAVTLGGSSATILSTSDTSVEVTTPSHSSGDVDVVAITSVGGTAPVRFTYADPRVTSSSHRRLDPAGDQRVVLYGSDLARATAVAFDGVAGQIVSSNDREVVVRTPPHKQGTVSMVLTTDAGQVAPRSFEYVDTSVFGLDYSSGPTSGQTVRIVGPGVNQASAVTFGNSAAGWVDRDYDGITVFTPSHAPGTVEVRVVTPNGAFTTQYTYVG